MPCPAGDQGSPAHHPDGTSGLFLEHKWYHCLMVLLFPVTHITPGPLEQATPHPALGHHAAVWLPLAPGRPAGGPPEATSRYRMATR